MSVYLGYMGALAAVLALTLAPAITAGLAWGEVSWQVGVAQAVWAFLIIPAITTTLSRLG